MTEIERITFPYENDGVNGECISHHNTPVKSYTVEEGDDASEGAQEDYCVYAFQKNEGCGGCLDNIFDVGPGESTCRCDLSSMK